MASTKTSLIKDSSKVFVMALLALLSGGLVAAHAQEQPKPGDQADAPTAKQNEIRPQQEQEKKGLRSTLEILGKRSLFFPDLAADRGRLSSRKKLELAVDETIAPSRFSASAFTSALSQARNALPGYGQGWEGYGKRFGSSMASGASSHFVGTFLLPSMLHQDPRYFVKLHGSVGDRVGYALRRIFVTHTDNGREAFNWSGIIGALVAESIANSYLPDAERTTGKTFSRFGIRMGFSAVSNVAKEYWPTIFRSLRISKLVPSETSDPGTVTPPPNKPPKKP